MAVDCETTWDLLVGVGIMLFYCLAEVFARGDAH